MSGDYLELKMYDYEIKKERAKQRRLDYWLNKKVQKENGIKRRNTIMD